MLVNYDIIAHKYFVGYRYRSNHLIFFSPKEDTMSLQKLVDELEILKVEYEKFERGNKSAGTRARKSLQNIKKICQEIRIQIQEAKKSE
jgi:hypothetical protein